MTLTASLSSRRCPSTLRHEHLAARPKGGALRASSPPEGTDGGGAPHSPVPQPLRAPEENTKGTASCQSIVDNAFFIGHAIETIAIIT